MIRGEKFTEDSEIRRNFAKAADPESGAGPILKVIGKDSYIDDGEAHVAIIGNTGKGKSQGVTLPLVSIIGEKNESGVFIDSKGELFKKAGSSFSHYEQNFCIDLSRPLGSPDCWNPLSLIYSLYRSSEPTDVDIAMEMIHDFASCIRYDSNEEAFWSNSACQLVEACIFALFDLGKEDEISLNNVATILRSLEKGRTKRTMISEGEGWYRSLYDKLSDTFAKSLFSSYVGAPDETRASIFSLANVGVSQLTRSSGLMKLLASDSLCIDSLDVNKPFVIWIILPSETDAYDAIAGVLVSQISRYLQRITRNIQNNSLPIRCNIVLEELGSVGKSIPSLDRLCAQGRSSNIRVYLVLQSAAQLDDVYGKAKADIIKSCIGITIGFSSNDYSIMEDWSLRCGNTSWITGDIISEGRLIPTAKILALPTGCALVMVDGRYKFISKLPLYYQTHDIKEYNPVPSTRPIRYAKKVSLSELIRRDRAEDSATVCVNTRTEADRVALIEVLAMFKSISLREAAKRIPVKESRISFCDPEEARQFEREVKKRRIGE